ATDIVLTEERMASSRDFANKIWNAARFLFLKMEYSGVEPWVPESLEQFQPEPDPTTLEIPIEDRWIFSRLNNAAEQVNRAIEQYRYHEAAQTLWHFFWHEFCDWYVELKKLRFQENSGLDAGWRNMLAAFETALRLLHPAMPFLTEELWQRLVGAGQAPPARPVSIALALYPQYRQELTDYEAEREIDVLQEIVTMARTLRAESKLDPKQQLSGAVYSRNSVLEVAQRHAEPIQKLANVKLDFKSEAAPKSAAVRSTAQFDLVLQLPQAQQDAQRKRMEKDREQLAKNIANSRRQLDDDAFLAKAPPPVVETIRRKLADYEEQLRKIEDALVQ
ncbi:MAG: class I tRNA ligase family protein, partial [Acidobacteriia bacterium]|nr:class I tRNA ligase family protein [Terriglobia bacterium]